MKKRCIALSACAWIAIASASGAAERVATRMRHVVFHMGGGVELRVDDLDGHLVSTTAGPPVFDDVNSYLVEIRWARVAMTPASLTNLMNNHVFADRGAPIKRLEIAIEGQHLKQAGVLRKGIDVPFSMEATIAATADGRIRMHPTTLKAAGVVPKRVLDFFGLELDRLVKMGSGSGVTVDGDDLLLDPQRLLPPPRIRGRLAKAWIENGLIVQEFGVATARSLTPPQRSVTNYMYYRGGTLRFGKLTMSDTDLLLVDANPKNPFDFSPERYNDQLVAGYSKTTREHGLIVYMPDLADLKSGPDGRGTFGAHAER